tara:strand:+ start:3403 stop:3945 length:543 start_codon:yes stop_codon:yes gene_type:complete
MDNALKEKLAQIKLLICDVDGVLTDGTLIYATNGEQSKNFSVLDGVGFHMINRLDINLKTAWITGRECATTSHRAEKLKIDKVYNGVIRKIESYNELKKEYNIEDHEICFIGDDIIDMPLFEKVGLAVSVPNAPDYVSKHAHYITSKAGGHGAVREVIDLIISSRGNFDDAINLLLSELR